MVTRCFVGWVAWASLFARVSSHCTGKLALTHATHKGTHPLFSKRGALRRFTACIRIPPSGVSGLRLYGTISPMSSTPLRS